MSDKLTALFEKFVSEARSLLISETQAMLGNMAGGGGGQPDPLIRKKPGPKPKGAAPAAKDGRSRRSPEDLEKQATQILNFISKHPGSRAEQIGSALGLSSGEMQIPIAALLKSKKAKKSGVKRATNYTATGK